MCKEEDDGVRPVHRPREWRREDRKLAKLSKKQSWNKGGKSGVSSSHSESLVGQLQEECRRFEEKFGIRVSVVTRAGQSVRRDEMAEPLRVVGCDREQ